MSQAGKLVDLSGSGDVVGPASATDNAVARWDTTSGKLLQDSVVLVGDTGNVSGVGTLAMSDQLTNTLAIGTAPFVITSTTLVTNLNADLLDGVQAADMDYTFVSGNDAATDVTGAQLETLSDGSDAGALHIHDARYYTETELGAVASGASGCDLIGSPTIGTPTFTTLCERLNLMTSAGRVTGGMVTDAGSEDLNVALGTGLIKATDSDTAEVLSFDWVANPALSTTTDTHQYAGVIYNAGTPIVDIRATENYDLDTEFPLASIVNEGGTLHILNNPWWVTDGITNIIERFRADGYIVRDANVGGLTTSVPGTRNLAVTAGTLWSNLNEFPVAAIDTNTAKVASHSAVFDVDNGSSKGTITASAGTPYTGLSADEYVAITGTGDNDGTYKIESVAGGNVITMTTVISGTDGTEAATVITGTFEYYSYDGVAGTWSDTHNTQYSVTQWNDTTMAALQTIDNNKYVNMWVYAEADDQEISIVYGQAQYVSAAGAEAEAPPTLIPTHIKEHGFLIARILIKQAVDAPIEISIPWETVFTASQAADHGNLAGLSGDDHPQYLLADGTRALAGAWDMGSQATTNVNIDSGVITGITDLLVPDGGTGVSTLTDGGVMLGSGVGAITVTAQPTDGQLLIGSTGNDPVLANLTQPANGLTITGGAGTVTFALANGLAALEALASTGMVAHTGADTYSERTITGTAPIVVSNGNGVSGNPTISVTGGGLSSENITDSTKTAVINYAYTCDRAGGVVFTLPSTAAYGSIIKIIGLQGLWTVGVNSGETIYIGNTNCTTTSGTLVATNAGDCIELFCILADTNWRVTNSMGNITVT